MSTPGGAGLKFIQWIIRAIQFCCSVVVLGVYSYFLATLLNHGKDVPDLIKAVEGISAIGTVYTLLSLVLVCCLSSRPFPSFVFMVVDGGFVAAYIYIAAANRAGAGTCAGNGIETVYGTGDDVAVPDLGDGAMALPTFGTTCRLETVCLSASIIAA